MQNEEFELTDAERAALAGLSRELAPGNLLEERVIRALQAAGHLGVARRAAHPWSHAAIRAAAAAALFAGGVATGRYLLLPGDSALRATAAETAAQSAPSGPRVEAATPVRNGARAVAQREMWL